MWKAIGSAFSRHWPSAPRMRNLYFVPEPTSGTNSSQMPDEPSWRMGCSRPSQLLKSPLIRTPLADGAHTAKEVPSIGRGAEPLVAVPVGAEHGPQLLVPALVDEVEVHLAEAGQEAVGVVAGDRALAVVDLDAVVGDVGHGQLAGPDAGVLVVELDALLALRAVVDDPDGLGQRLEDAHGDLPSPVCGPSTAWGWPWPPWTSSSSSSAVTWSYSHGELLSSSVAARRDLIPPAARSRSGGPVPMSGRLRAS